MNAAGRLVHHSLFTRHLVMSHFVSKKQMTVFLLVFAVLLSALSIIYVTQTTREIHAMLQRNLVEHDHMKVERGQLLLERSLWMMQSRIQQIAENKLGMISPDHQSVVIVHE